mmetsp:Transcript_16019/g.61046  ORF Transcript_16019/g.61046 Transcript_16019/m.61046 type:complete len:353 (+) Transcript_16019:300-1358(+)
MQERVEGQVPRAKPRLGDEAAESEQEGPPDLNTLFVQVHAISSVTCVAACRVHGADGGLDGWRAILQLVGDVGEQVERLQRDVSIHASGKLYQAVDELNDVPASCRANQGCFPIAPCLVLAAGLGGLAIALLASVSGIALLQQREERLVGLRAKAQLHASLVRSCQAEDGQNRAPSGLQVLALGPGQVGHASEDVLPNRRNLRMAVNVLKRLEEHALKVEVRQLGLLLEELRAELAQRVHRDHGEVLLVRDPHAGEMPAHCIPDVGPFQSAAAIDVEVRDFHELLETEDPRASPDADARGEAEAEANAEAAHRLAQLPASILFAGVIATVLNHRAPSRQAWPRRGAPPRFRC